MIPPEKITKGKLSKILVSKHKKILQKYKKEFETLDRIRVIKDKQELLEHWLKSANNQDEEGKYIKELEVADAELSKLNDELLKNYGEIFNTKEHYNSLKNKIKIEEQAILYWKEKSREWKNQN